MTVPGSSLQLIVLRHLAEGFHTRKDCAVQLVQIRLYQCNCPSSTSCYKNIYAVSLIPQQSATFMRHCSNICIKCTWTSACRIFQSWSHSRSQHSSGNAVAIVYQYSSSKKVSCLHMLCAIFWLLKPASTSREFQGARSKDPHVVFACRWLETQRK